MEYFIGVFLYVFFGLAIVIGEHQRMKENCFILYGNTKYVNPALFVVLIIWPIFLLARIYNKIFD